MHSTHSLFMESTAAFRNELGLCFSEIKQRKNTALSGMNPESVFMNESLTRSINDSFKTNDLFRSKTAVWFLF